MTSIIKLRVGRCYRELLRSASDSSCEAIFRAADDRLPYPVVVRTAPAKSIAGCPATGQAFTDHDIQQHVITLASELKGRARDHTLAHEYFHLLYHVPHPATIEQMISYYASLPECADVPRSVLRYLVHQATPTMYRATMEAEWEQEAEEFATLVVTQATSKRLPPSRSPLLIALGAPDVRR